MNMYKCKNKKTKLSLRTVNPQTSFLHQEETGEEAKKKT